MAPEVDLSGPAGQRGIWTDPLALFGGYRLCFIFDVNPGWLADGVGNEGPAGALELPTPETQPNGPL